MANNDKYNKNNYVVCIKVGDKYSPDYVNRLYNMVNRHLTIPYEFVCFTEDKSGIYQKIQTYNIFDKKIKGSRNKLVLFDENLPISGTILYLDLDICIFRNMNCLFDYSPGDFCIIHDYYNRYKYDDNFPIYKSIPLIIINRFNRFKKIQYNSSVFRFEAKKYGFIWTNFLKERESIESRFFGDQQWITECMKYKARVFPYNWCMSYKWEIAGKINTNIKPTCYEPKKNINLPKDCIMAVFHGLPNPDDVLDDPLINKNWR